MWMTFRELQAESELSTIEDLSVARVDGCWMKSLWRVWQIQILQSWIINFLLTHWIIHGSLGSQTPSKSTQTSSLSLTTILIYSASSATLTRRLMWLSWLVSNFSSSQSLTMTRMPPLAWAFEMKGNIYHPLLNWRNHFVRLLWECQNIISYSHLWLLKPEIRQKGDESVGCNSIFCHSNTDWKI